ncbi:hypothetical protein ElyMa_004067400 [Elysia marginata]|uniref:Uncharacterized protein n=1 Tax=Elysia marginata TaxID=1093978 RepID=A0AAV4G798_9GAST|nr:hypothetical protein ElyMa_004067400 [Elysia marginata]
MNEIKTGKEAIHQEISPSAGQNDHTQCGLKVDHAYDVRLNINGQSGGEFTELRAVMTTTHRFPQAPGSVKLVERTHLTLTVSLPRFQFYEGPETSRQVRIKPIPGPAKNDTDSPPKKAAKYPGKPFIRPGTRVGRDISHVMTEPSNEFLVPPHVMAIGKSASATEKQYGNVRKHGRDEERTERSNDFLLNLLGQTPRNKLLDKTEGYEYPDETSKPDIISALRSEDRIFVDSDLSGDGAMSEARQMRLRINAEQKGLGPSGDAPRGTNKREKRQDRTSDARHVTIGQALGDPLEPNTEYEIVVYSLSTLNGATKYSCVSLSARTLPKPGRPQSWLWDILAVFFAVNTPIEFL